MVVPSSTKSSSNSKRQVRRHWEDEKPWIVAESRIYNNAITTEVEQRLDQNNNDHKHRAASPAGPSSTDKNQRVILSSPVSAVYTNHATSPIITSNDEAVNDTEEEDLGTPIPCHPPSEEDSPMVSPKKLESRFTVPQKRTSHSYWLRGEVWGTPNSIRLVALVICVALWMDATWPTTPSRTDVTNDAFQQQQQSSLITNKDAMLVSIGNTIQDRLPAVDVEDVATKGALANVFETVGALELTDTTDTIIRENQMEWVDTNLELSTKSVPDDNTTRVVLLEAAPSDGTIDLSTSLAPQTEDKPKSSHSSSMSSLLVGTSVALSEDGDIMAIASASSVQQSDGYSISLHGWVRVFSRTKRSQIGKDISLGALDEEALGSDVIISLSPKGICMVAGWSGQIRLYQKASGGWVEDVKVHGLFQNQIYQGALISSVAISADCNTVVVAADSIYTARKWGTRWSLDSENQSLTTAGTSERSFSRVSLSADASRMAVGLLSLNDDGNTAGSIRVWTRYPHSSKWLELGRPILNMDTPRWSRARDLVSMSSDGSTIAVGHNPAGKSGVVRIYSYDSGESEWKQMGSTLVGEAGPSFGHALSLSSNGTCVAVRDNEGLFMAYEFEPVSAIWNDLGEAFHSNVPSVKDEENANDYNIAYPKVALSGDCQWIAIGDPTYRNGTGVAHMFQL